MELQSTARSLINAGARPPVGSLRNMRSGCSSSASAYASAVFSAVSRFVSRARDFGAAAPSGCGAAQSGRSQQHIWWFCP